jgi:hypothetical protein
MGKVAIVQFDDRSDAVLGPMRRLIDRNAAYAAARGYTHVLATKPAHDIPIFWNKVHVIAEHLANGFDCVAWLDSDAVVHDFSLDIPALFDGEQAFVFAGDLPVWQRISPFNAGVFFVKGASGLALMREWQALYPAHLWRKQGAEWICPEQPWAGPAYEQGAFAEKLVPKFAASGLLKQLPWQALQSPYPLPQSLTLHFQNSFRANFLLYLKMLETP